VAFYKLGDCVQNYVEDGVVLIGKIIVKFHVLFCGLIDIKPF
jgi:hypothetical protein